ncbi:MAG TPA: NADH-quinone oxidoreductase subunit M, partial [Acidimicrobiales bacterium]
SAFLLVGIVSIAFIHKSQTGVLTFDLPALMHTHLSGTEGVLLFCAFTAAFAVKAPIFPFHTWSPDAYSEAPTAGAILLVAIMAKLGTYGVIRFDLNLFPQASRTLAPVLLTLATIGIIYGAIVAAMQKNLKRLVAYSSVSHMGFAVLGLFALTTLGLEGSVLVMINHGIITGALFILLGFIYKRRHTYDIDQLKGLQKVAPWLAGVFTLVMLASIGVPGLSGFVGEFLVLLGTFISHRWWAVVAATGVIIAALYLLWAYQRVFHGEPDEANLGFPDLAIGEKLVMLPLVALIVFLGIYPKPVLERIEPSIKALLAHVELVNHDAGNDFHVANTQDGEHLSPTSASEGAPAAGDTTTTTEGGGK